MLIFKKFTHRKLLIILSAIILLIIIVAIIITVILSYQPDDSADQLTTLLDNTNAVINDTDSCFTLQAVYATIDDATFTTYYDNCTTALDTLAASPRPTADSDALTALYAALDAFIPLAREELSVYQAYRDEHASTIGTNNPVTDYSDPNLQEATDNPPAETASTQLYNLYYEIHYQIDVINGTASELPTPTS